MAWQTKSIIGDGSKGHHRFTLTVTEDSTNVNTNKSYISWKFELSQIGNGWGYDWAYNYQIPVTYIVNINGVQRASGNIMNYDGTSTVTITSGEDYIQHDSNGKKDISFSFSIWSMDVDYLPGAASASGSMSLKYIPRQATLISAPNFTDEDSNGPTITYSNPAGDAVKELKACIVYGSQQAYLAVYRTIPTTGSSYTFSDFNDIKNKLYAATNATSKLTVTFYVTTVIGDNTYWSTLDRTATIKDSPPELSEAKVVDTGTISVPITGDNNVIISGINYMDCSIKVTPKKGATIKSATVKCNGKVADLTLDGGKYVGGLDRVDHNSFIFTVTDSRGLVSTTTVNKSEFIQYFKPSINSTVFMTLDGDDDSKASATITSKGNCYVGALGKTTNNPTVWYQYQELNGNEWGSWSGWYNHVVTSDELIGNSYTAIINVDGLSSEKTYRFNTCITDAVHKDSSNNTIYSPMYIVNTVPVFDYDADDFAFNVPVTIQGKTAVTLGMNNRVTKAQTFETVAYAASSYINFKRSDNNTAFYNEDMATFNNNGLITINKNMLALVNIHVCAHTKDSGRLWVKLVNYNTTWKYAESLTYGSFATATISVIVNLAKDNVLGVATNEAMEMNSSGFNGSYIEIIEL